MEKLNEQLKKFDLDTIKDKKITYSLILHQQRERLGISITEYCIADMVYHYGGLEKSRQMGGWCYASKQQLANNLSVNKRTIERGINELLKKGLLEKESETKHLRSTSKWYSEVIVYKAQIKKSRG